MHNGGKSKDTGKDNEQHLKKQKKKYHKEKIPGSKKRDPK